MLVNENGELGFFINGEIKAKATPGKYPSNMTKAVPFHETLYGVINMFVIIPNKLKCMRIYQI